MTIPQWVLLGFAAWTLLTLFLTVGVIRWSQILTGRTRISEFRADVPQGSDLYRRAMRAHANCVENLPVYGAVVVCLGAAGVDTPLFDRLAIVILAARILQTVTHVAFEPSDPVVSLRFAFFFTQIVCIFWMGIALVLAAS